MERLRNAQIRFSQPETAGVAVSADSVNRDAAMKLQGLDHVAIAVSDVERSAHWYVDVLGFERQHPGMWGGTPVFVGNAHASVALFPNTDKRHGSGTIRHFAFRTSGDDFEAAQCELKTRGIDFEFEDHEITHSIYFHDPDGHKIEVTTYDLFRQSARSSS